MYRISDVYEYTGACVLMYRIINICEYTGAFACVHVWDH